MGKTKRGKGSKLMAMAEGTGPPISLSVTSASRHEGTLAGLSGGGGAGSTDGAGAGWRLGLSLRAVAEWIEGTVGLRLGVMMVWRDG